MRTPLRLVVVIVVLLAGAALFFARRRPAPVIAPDRPKTGALSPARAGTPPTVAIQDGKTLDFSSGKPVLKDSAEEKAIIAQAVKEMNEAAAGVTFGQRPAPPAPPAADTKKPAPQE